MGLHLTAGNFLKPFFRHACSSFALFIFVINALQNFLTALNVVRKHFHIASKWKRKRAGALLNLKITCISQKA